MGTHLGWGHRMVALLSGAALVTGLVTVSVPASAQRAAGSLTASPSTAIAGEKVTFTGALGVSGARKVVLQRKQGADWVKVIGGASTKRGKFTLVSTVRPTTTKYRVRAPAAKVGGTARPAVITRSRTVTTQAQSATLALPAAAAVGAAVTATATFAPARPGRPVQLQRQVGAGWSAARTGVQGPDGTASFPVDTSVPGTQVYRVVTTAANGAGETASASRTLVVTAATPVPPPPDTTPPGPVTGLTVTGTTATSVTLAWTNPSDSDLTAVMVRRAVGPTPPGSPTSGTLVVDKAKPGATHVDTGLTPGTQYSYALFAHDGVPNYATSATVTSSTGSPDTTPPAPVTGVSVTGTTTTTVSLGWTNPADSDLSGVMIRRAVGPTPPATPTAGTLVVDKAAPGTTHTDTGLSAGTQYSYALFAHDGVPNYATSATVSGGTDTPDTTPPGPVTGVGATKTATTVSLSWTNPGAGDLAGVMIRRAAGGTPPATASSGTLVASVTAPGTTYVDSGLAPATQYSYALFAYDEVPNHATGAGVTVTTAVASTSDWDQPGHDGGHSGWAPDEQVITPANAATVGQEFTIPGDGSPVIAGGLLYTTGTTDLGTTLLAAYDLGTAAPVWQVPTNGQCSGPVAVTASVVIVNCGGKPRAYDRTGSHAVVWDVADTDPGQNVQNHLVVGTSLVAWSQDRVAAYRLSDGQRVWQQLLPSGATFIHDVAASGTTVVVAYDDRLRALSLAAGGQLWVRTGLLSGTLVIAGGWVYAHPGGVARQFSLATGADGWSAAVPSVYSVVAVDGDTVYVWEAEFDFSSPVPSILHALRTSDGTQRWQYDVPSRLRDVGVTGDVVWLTSTGIYSQEHASDLIALKRSDGSELRRISYDDNMYGYREAAFGAGKVVVDQGGSFGGPPRQLRVLGLAGPVPTIDDEIVPLAYVGTAYARQLTAQGAGPFTWTVTSGTLPTGVSLSATGLLNGTPTVAGTKRVRIRVNASNGRSSARFVTLQAVQTGTPDWSMLGRDATRNPFEVSVPSLDVDTAPTLGFRWKTALPGPANTQYNSPVTVGTRLYDVGVDGVLRAWETTGSTTNRPALWTADPETGADPATSFVASPVVASDRLIVLDAQTHLNAVRASDGVPLWRTTDPVSTSYLNPPLVVGSSILVITQTGGVKAYSAATGAPLWGGAETSAADDFMSTSLSSNGTLAYTVTGCELYALNVSTGAIVWHTPMSAPLNPACSFFIDYAPPPIVVEGVVYASTPWGLMSADAATGAPLTRIASGARGSHLVVGGVWMFLWDETLYAVDTGSGDVLWKTREVTNLGGLAASRDLVVAQTYYGQMVGLDRVTGDKVWEAAGSGASGAWPAIGAGRIYATTNEGVYAYGPL